MKKRLFFTALLVPSIVFGVTVAGIPVSPPTQAAVSAQDADTTVVVDDDGNGDYRSIQKAIDNAATGDTIEVRPGTYSEQLVLDKTITLVAPQGATLDGSNIVGEEPGITIAAESGAEPVVDGFTITRHYIGVAASNTVGSWSIRNATIRQNRDEGIEAEETHGAWVVKNTTIERNGDDGIDGDTSTGAWTVQNATVLRNSGDGIDVENASGPWTVRTTTIRVNEQGVVTLNSNGDWTIRASVISDNQISGVNAGGTSGKWTVAATSLHNNSFVAVSTAESSGAWTIRETTIQNSTIGVFASQASGDWTVERTAIRNMVSSSADVPGVGTGIFANESSGAGEVHNSSFVGNANHAINATGAVSQQDATHNWWGGQSGPATDACAGKVDCSEPLSEPPTIDSPSAEAADLNAGSATTATGLDRFGVKSIAIVLTLFSIVSVLGVLALRQH